MTTRRLQWIGIFWIFILWLMTLIIHLVQGQPPMDIATLWLSLWAAVSAVFTIYFAKAMQRQETEVERRTQQLEALHSAALSLTTELRLKSVLQKVVDLSCQLSGARYGALGVLGEDGRTISQFITTGISHEQRLSMGQLPTGKGLLGALIEKGEPMRIANIKLDGRSVGFPPNHPPMKSLLGVPIRSKGRVIGDIYLTDKMAYADTHGPKHSPEYDHEKTPLAFSEQDQDILEMFATQAAIAIDNAQLYRQTQELAVLQERERFSMDLHDGIIQAIYAIGLMLEDCQFNIESAPLVAQEQIGQAIRGLNEVIRDIRNYILDLRPERFQGRNLSLGLEELAREIRANTFFSVDLETSAINSTRLSPEQTVEILHIAQEALANIRKHARPTRVGITAEMEEDTLFLIIEDDGVGFNANGANSNRGNGLRNMRERANNLNGIISYSTRKSGGASVRLIVPLADEDIVPE